MSDYEDIMDLLGPSVAPFEPSSREVSRPAPPTVRDTTSQADLWIPTSVAFHYREYDRSGPALDELTEQIRQDGILTPLSLSTDGNVAVIHEGNHRLQAARQLGIQQVPVKVTLDSPVISNGGRVTPLESYLSSWLDRNQDSLRSFWGHRTASDYFMQHRPAGPDYGGPMHDVSDFFPDIETLPTRMYDFGEPGSQDSIRQIIDAQGNPNKSVTIYRAVPKGADPIIRNGDWVTISREYAEQHGMSNADGNYDVLSATVQAKDIWTDGNSVNEFGYWGPELRTARTYTASVEDGSEYLRTPGARIDWTPSEAPFDGIWFGFNGRDQTFASYYHAGKYDEEYYLLNKAWSDERIAKLQWTPSGEVAIIWTKTEYRRIGLATALFNWTKSNISPGLQHSDDMTSSGHEWAKSMGHDPEDWELMRALPHYASANAYAVKGTLPPSYLTDIRTVTSGRTASSDIIARGFKFDEVGFELARMETPEWKGSCRYPGDARSASSSWRSQYEARIRRYRGEVGGIVSNRRTAASSPGTLYRGLAVPFSEAQIEDVMEAYGKESFVGKVLSYLSRGFFTPNREWGIGKHWTTNASVAKSFSQNGFGTPVVLVAEWDGSGEDPYNAPGNNFGGEDEVTLLPETELRLVDVLWGPTFESIGGSGRTITAGGSLPPGLRMENPKPNQVVAYDDDNPDPWLSRFGVGVLSWDDDGVISWVAIQDDSYKRKGIATAMLEYARAIRPDIRHSDELSESGAGWAQAVGSRTAGTRTDPGGVYRGINVQVLNHDEQQELAEWANANAFSLYDYQLAEPNYELVYRILDRLDSGGLGRHWSKDYDVSADFARDQGDGIELILIGHWEGEGVDTREFHRGWDGVQRPSNIPHEEEVTLYPGTPVTLVGMDIVTETGFTYNIPVPNIQVTASRTAAEPGGVLPWNPSHRGYTWITHSDGTLEAVTNDGVNRMYLHEYPYGWEWEVFDSLGFVEGGTFGMALKGGDALRDRANDLLSEFDSRAERRTRGPSRGYQDDYTQAPNTLWSKRASTSDRYREMMSTSRVRHVDSGHVQSDLMWEAPSEEGAL